MMIWAIGPVLEFVGLLCGFQTIKLGIFSINFRIDKMFLFSTHLGSSLKAESPRTSYQLLYQLKRGYHDFSSTHFVAST